MKKHLLLLLCSILLIATSCRNDNNEGQIESKNQINFQLIGKGNLMGSSYSTPQNSVITNTTQWNNFLNQIDTPNNHPSSSFTETNINFNQFMVILVVDEVYPNGGHSVDIMTIDENPQNIEVDVENCFREM